MRYLPNRTIFLDFQGGGIFQKKKIFICAYMGTFIDNQRYPYI